MHVEAINIGPSDAIAPVQAASAFAGKGLQGDRHFYQEGAAPGQALTLIEAEVLDGRLVEVLPRFRPAPMPVHLLYAHRRQLPRRVQAFMQWLAELLAPRLLPLSSASSVPTS